MGGIQLCDRLPLYLTGVVKPDEVSLIIRGDYQGWQILIHAIAIECHEVITELSLAIRRAVAGIAIDRAAIAYSRYEASITGDKVRAYGNRIRIDRSKEVLIDKLHQRPCMGPPAYRLIVIRQDAIHPLILGLADSAHGISDGEIPALKRLAKQRMRDIRTIVKGIQGCECRPSDLELHHPYVIVPILG